MFRIYLRPVDDRRTKVTVQAVGLVKKFTAGPANPRVPPNPSPPWRQVVAEFTNVLKLRERSDTFAWDDPLPAFAELRRMLWKRIMKIARPVRHPPRLVDLPSPAERR